MTKVKRSMKPTCPVALLLGALAGLAFAADAVAQPGDEPAAEEQEPVAEPAADEPAAEEPEPVAEPAANEPASEERPAAAAPDQTSTEPTTAQPAPASSAVAAQPPPFAPPPLQYPIARRPRQVAPAEPAGPVISWAPLHFAVAFERRTSWLLDDGAQRVVGDKRASASGLSLQADVLRTPDNLAVRLDLGWVRMSQSASSADYRLWQQFKSNLIFLGIALRYDLLRWLAPYARVSGGIGWDKLTVVDLHDRQLFGQGSVGAGLFLRSPGLHLWTGPRAPAVAVTGQVEGGYAMASGSDFVLQADARTSSEHPIPIAAVPLGHVDRNHPYLRISLGLAF